MTLDNPCKRPVDVTLTAPITCRCPVNRRQDHGTVTITYRPDKELIEYATLVEWLATFAHEAHSHEALTDKLLTGVVVACAPKRAEVVTIWEPVEGVRVTCRCATSA